MAQFSVRFTRALVCLLIGTSLLLGSGMVLHPRQAKAQAQPAEAGLETLSITTSSGSHKFSVEVMRTDEERAKGLMFRRFMPQDRGMLFHFKREEQVAMWMKNTYLSLDMLFIDRTGKIVNIAQNAEPLSERIIPSGAPTYAVLELNAGVAKKLAMKIGDKVEHSMFRK